MMLKATADLLDGILREKKIEKYTYTLSQSEKQELNLENNGFKLLRTVFSNSASVKVFSGAKMGSASGNDREALHLDSRLACRRGGIRFGGPLP